MATLDNTDEAVGPFVAAIRAGDELALRQCLASRPDLATARMTGAGGGTRTALHVATDWPGYYPNGPEVVDMLIAAGADPNARTAGRGMDETPLHWAASSDDSDVADALIDGGADIDAPDGSIGTPLANAVGYGCWHVARLLVARGAAVRELWTAAALGLTPRVTEFLAGDPAPTADDINQAFWHACSGGQRRVAEILLARGANINAFPGYTTNTPLDAAAQPGTRKDLLQDWLRELGARSSEQED